MSHLGSSLEYCKESYGDHEPAVHSYPCVA
jgi:hypothetical protein